MAKLVLDTITLVKNATAICDLCGAEIHHKVKHIISANAEIDGTVVNLEKLYWESGSHLCDTCKSKFNV